MDCCNENIIDLGCVDSCNKIILTLGTGVYAPNELYIMYEYNGAIKKILITIISDTGEPIIDMSIFNEDYVIKFSLYKVSDNTLLNCYKVKVLPCEQGLIIPNIVNNLVGSITQCIGYTCIDNKTKLDISIELSNISAVKNGSRIYIAYDIDIPASSIELVSSELGIVIINNTTIEIINSNLITSTLLLSLKISGCVDRVINIGVNEIDNMTLGWGNGTHIKDIEYKIIF